MVKKQFKIISDITDIDKVLKAINKKRERLKHKQITKDELINEIEIIDKELPQQKLKFSIDFDKLSIALYKIAYELAFLWLGEKYFNDKYAIKIRKIINEAIKGEYTKEYINNIRIFNKQDFPGDPYENKPYYNIGFLNANNNIIFAEIRILNTIVGNFILTKDAEKYSDFVPKIVLNDARTKKT